MNLKKAIDILENVIADEVIGTYCIEIQKTVECSKNCENEDCFLQQAIDIVLSELNRLQKSEEDLMIKAGKIACEMSLEIDRLKESKQEMRKVAFEEGYNQGYLAGAMERI